MRYTRRRDRILAMVWPPKRRQLRQLRMMRKFAQHIEDEMNETRQRAGLDMLLYGTTHVRIKHPRIP